MLGGIAVKCPYCGHSETRVVDSRESEDVTRRRRSCEKCTKRWTTYERVESAPLYVIKKDGTRELFDAEKIRKGFLLSCQKRPISIEQINTLVSKIEAKARSGNTPEVPSKSLGEEVMKQLKRLDHVAYVRFASVYHEFTDVRDFKKEIQALGKKER